jgi:hypothetical protein
MVFYTTTSLHQARQWANARIRRAAAAASPVSTLGLVLQFDLDRDWLATQETAKEVREACARHHGFYLGSIGGSAARLAQHRIKKVEVHEYPELGMEAIWRMEVENFPAFKGNDFFKELNLGCEVSNLLKNYAVEARSRTKRAGAVCLAQAELGRQIRVSGMRSSRRACPASTQS